MLPQANNYQRDDINLLTLLELRIEQRSYSPSSLLMAPTEPARVDIVAKSDKHILLNLEVFISGVTMLGRVICLLMPALSFDLMVAMFAKKSHRFLGICDCMSN